MSTIGDGPLPDLVPARMVNAYVYCPRLFYLEWVQSRFATNEEVDAGRLVHRAVDQQRGVIDLGAIAELRRATSVQLSSERLGLIATVDVLEQEDGSAVPVDVKRGRVPERGPWPSDRAQLCIAAVLLRESGVRCDKGYIYYAASRSRVEVPITDELVVETLRAVLEAREVAQADQPPPPLVDSPKCPRCSLVGICLPDEINLELGRRRRPPRRIIPTVDNGHPLYVTTPGARAGVRHDRIEVRRGDELLASERILDVTQLCVLGNAQVSTRLLHRLAAEEIPVLYLSAWGWLRAVATGLPSKWVDLRMRQVAMAYAAEPSTAAGFVEGKIHNAATLLRRNARRPVDDVVANLRDLERRAREVPDHATLLGIEGAAARLYFGAFDAMLRPDRSFPGGPFEFAGRNRRPPRDAVNAMLSFCYALLVKDLVATCVGVGFDPYIGLFHRPRFGRPALALDLAEEFRPLVADSTVVNLINNDEIRPSHFIERAGAVSLTAEGRRRVIAAYERRIATAMRHPLFGYRATGRRLMNIQARLLASRVVGEIDRYTPIKVR